MALTNKEFNEGVGFKVSKLSNNKDKDKDKDKDPE